MRTIKFILVFSFIFLSSYSSSTSIFAQSGWNIIHNNHIQNYVIKFINSQYGWVAGASGGYLTSNGGNNWVFKLGGRINAIDFVNMTRGFAVGFDQKIYYTINFGFDWVTQYTGTTGLELWSVDNATGTNTYLAVGDSGKILRTVNDGTNWNLVPISTNNQLRTICLIDATTGWIGSTSADSNHGQIFKTTNSGLNWFVQNNTSQKGIWSFSFINAITGWACALKGVVMKTTNGGENWIIQLSSNNHFYSIFFTDENHGWIGGSSPSGVFGVDTALIKFTSNGGINWTEQYRGSPGLDNIVHSVFFINDSCGWAALSDGKILKTTTGGSPIGIKPIGIEVPDEYILYQNYPNPFNPTTKIKFSLPLPSEGGAMDVTLKIYDILGKEVASLIPPQGLTAFGSGGQEGLKPGTYEVEWDASYYPSGVYFYKLDCGEFTDVKKMVLIK